jgi:hypothetical protein
VEVKRKYGRGSREKQVVNRVHVKASKIIGQRSEQPVEGTEHRSDTNTSGAQIGEQNQEQEQEHEHNQDQEQEQEHEHNQDQDQDRDRNHE